MRREMHPFQPEELGKAFRLDRVLRWGSLPVIWSAPDPQEALEAYVQMYLREEIQSEAIVRNLPGFARFLPIAALFHGQTLNTAGLARDAQVARSTVVGYVSVLEDTLLVFLLPPYEGRLRVKEQKLPKLYWCDPGLVRAVKRQLSPPTSEEKGALLAGWMAELLRSYRDYRSIFEDWYYWAPGEARETEVDFLLRRRREFVAVEVKAGSSFRASATRGLRAVGELKGLVRRILVYEGSRHLALEDGIMALAVDVFVERVASGRLFP